MGAAHSQEKELQRILKTPRAMLAAAGLLLAISGSAQAALVMTVTADTSFTRTNVWSIAKTADVPELALRTGETGAINWTVSVNKLAPEDSAWAVSGLVQVFNGGNGERTIVGIIGLVGGNAAATGCEFSGGLVLAPGESIVCPYRVDLTGSLDGTSDFEAFTNDADGVFSIADYSFGGPSTVVNASVNVMDTLVGDLGTIDANKVFQYETTHTFSQPGDFTIANTALLLEPGLQSTASVLARVSAVPEPATLGLVSLALAGLGAARHRRRRAEASLNPTAS